MKVGPGQPGSIGYAETRDGMGIYRLIHKASETLARGDAETDASVSLRRLSSIFSVLAAWGAPGPKR